MARMQGVFLSASLLGVAVAGIALVPGRTSGSVRADDVLPPRPNVVMLMVDDLDAGSTRTALQQGLLPNLDRYVFRGGTTFTESFVTLSLCAPSRATYLSGLYPHNHGVVRNSGVAGGFAHFDDRSTVATWLHAAGYRTAHVGKYLNGYADGTYVPPGWDDWQALVDRSTYCMYGYTVSNNGQPVTYGTADEDYQTDVLSGIAARFVESAESVDARPFFLSIAPLAPHLESACNPDGVRAAPRHLGSVDLDLPAPPSLNEADMSDKPAWMRRLPLRDEGHLRQLYNERLAALRAVDDLVGALAHTLEQRGELERTAFVFTSDNGYLLGQHRWESKVLVYEESIRVPLAVHLPGGGTPPVVTRMALNNDLAPTIAALARVQPPQPVDGRSLLPLLRGETPAWRPLFLVEYPPTGGRGIPPFYAVRAEGAEGRRGVVLSETLSFDGQRVRARELYDLEADPFQLESRADDPGSFVPRGQRSLEKRLKALVSCPSGGCPAREQ
jgi:N-acetylglucosamine-6-sulfatase